MPELTPKQEMSTRTRRSFLALGVGAAAGILGYEWLRNGEDEGGLSSRLRRVQAFNAKVSGGTLFDDGHLAHTFPSSAVEEPRVNGDEGLDDDVETANWRMHVIPYGQTSPTQKFSLAEIRAFPKSEHVTALNCIEGWSNVIHWGGVRFSDFTRAIAPGSEKARYVGLQTPDKEYYVGIDMESALHPQTLLCYEMNGKPLEDEHGAPLRLRIPVKYGIKNLKRIGTITYTDTQPADYWAERGYDYYAAL